VQCNAIRGRRTSSWHHSERGASRLKIFFYAGILLLAVYSAFKILPAYVSNYELEDKMQEQARFAVVNRYSEDQIRDNIFKVIVDLEIPANREDIQVLSTNSLVKISLNYTVPVDLKLYRLDLHFSPSSKNRAVF
jgi:DNA recombination-dependent growth factor C